jgi:hypothetical protein
MTEKPHEIIKNALAESLKLKGFYVKKEAPILNRRVDLLAEKDNEILIIEIVHTHDSKPLEDIHIKNLKIILASNIKTKQKSRLAIYQRPNCPPKHKCAKCQRPLRWIAGYFSCPFCNPDKYIKDELWPGWKINNKDHSLLPDYEEYLNARPPFILLSEP